MTPWKFTDSTDKVVARTLDDGSQEQRMASTLSADELAAVEAADLPSLIEIKVQIKSIRENSLRKFTKNSGVSKVYDINYDAAVLGASDNTTILRNGKTPYQHLYDFGLEIGMTAEQFATYIIDENRVTTAVAVKMTEIEKEYLRLYYSVVDTALQSELPALVSGFQSYCDLRTSGI